MQSSTTAGRKGIDPKGDGGWLYNFLKPLIMWSTPGLIPRYNGEQYRFGSAPFELSLLLGYRRRLMFVTDSKSELNKYLVWGWDRGKERERGRRREKRERGRKRQRCHSAKEKQQKNWVEDWNFITLPYFYSTLIKNLTIGSQLHLYTLFGKIRKTNVNYR